jgi:hypothetical protein
VDIHSNSFHSGKEVQGIWDEIELPKGISINEWISRSSETSRLLTSLNKLKIVKQMYNSTMAMYDKISHGCTSDTCKVMGGGAK